MPNQLYIGLMSGTSLDGIDVALVDFSQNKPELLASHLHPIPNPLKQQLLKLTLPGDNEIDRAGEADNQFAQCQVAAIEQLLATTTYSTTDIAAIGSHGQTIRHRPDFQSPFTLQIGNPALMAEQLDTTVIADFRRRDIAAGGEGAPLVPAFHEWLFRDPERHRVVVNIGGIANITVLASKADSSVLGYDTGPGNVLMDYWTQKHRQRPCDLDGQWASTGQTNPVLLKQLMETPYLTQPYPKSTGRELFNGPWLEQQLNKYGEEITHEDVQATLLAFTAKTIANSIKSHQLTPLDVFVCGGGANNSALMSALSLELSPHQVGITDTLGVPANWLEACAFAWLAKQCLEGKPGNLPAVTGAKGRRILGAIYQA